MTYRGHIENGVVVFDAEDVPLPNGAVVEIVPVEPRSAATESDVDPVYRLYELALPSGIPDMARNVDHYLYGHPKVDDVQP